jgi:hypothetical protein
VFDQDRKRKVFDVGDGIVTVATNKKRQKITATASQGHIGMKKNAVRSAHHESSQFVGRVMFRPRAANFLIKITVDRGNVLCDSYETVLPSISVCNIVPDESLVFQFASKGELESLKKLVADGKASLRDHDENGRSLLHARTHRALYMHKMLI